MNETEKIAARLAEFAAKLDLKGHTKLAEEVDELAIKTIAAFEAFEQPQSYPYTVDPDLQGEFESFPSGVFVENTDGSVLVFNDASQLENALSANLVSEASVLEGIKDALYVNKASDSLAKIKLASEERKFKLAYALAAFHTLIK